MSWLHAPFLAFAALAGVPLLLHWLLRDRLRRITFAGTRFLGASAAAAVTRTRWREFLLLVLRTLAILLLVVAFARPYLAHGDAGRPLAVVLVDCSRAMAAGGRFPRALAEARTVIAALPRDEQLVLGSIGPGGCRLTPLDPAAATLALAGLSPAGGPGDLVAALGLAGARCQERPSAIHLISALSAAEVPAGASATPLPATCRLIIHDVAQESDIPPDAVRVTAELTQGALGAGADDLGVAVRVATAGAGRSVHLRLRDGAQTLDEQDLPVPAGGNATTTLHGRRVRTGEVPLLVEATDAPGILPGDASAWVVAHRSATVQVVVRDGAPTHDPAHDPAFFVAAALAAGGGAHLQVRTVTQLPALTDVSAVVLACPRTITAGEHAALEAFLARGGGLLTILGPDTDAEALNASCGDLLPARLRAWRDGEVTLAQDPAAAAFVARILGDRVDELGVARVSGSAALSDATGSRVLLRFSDQRPALLMDAHGSGVSMLCATALDRRVGDLPLRPLFVPLVLETIASLHASAQGDDGLVTGAVVPLRGEERLEGPQGPCLPGADGEVRPAVPGLYHRHGPAGDQVLAVAGDAVSSDPLRIGVADLEHLVLPADRGVRATARGLTRTQDVDERRQAEAGTGLGRWCLVAVAALLLGELALAQTVARRGDPP